MRHHLLFVHQVYGALGVLRGSQALMREWSRPYYSVHRRWSDGNLSEPVDGYRAWRWQAPHAPVGHVAVRRCVLRAFDGIRPLQPRPADPAAPGGAEDQPSFQFGWFSGEAIREYLQSSTRFLLAEVSAAPDVVIEAAGDVQIFEGEKIVTIRDVHDRLRRRLRRSSSCIPEAGEAAEARACFDAAADLDVIASRALLTYSGYLGADLDQLEAEAARAIDFARDALYEDDDYRSEEAWGTWSCAGDEEVGYRRDEMDLMLEALAEAADALRTAMAVVYRNPRSAFARFRRMAHQRANATIPLVLDHPGTLGVLLPWVLVTEPDPGGPVRRNCRHGDGTYKWQPREVVFTRAGAMERALVAWFSARATVQGETFEY